MWKNNRYKCKFDIIFSVFKFKEIGKEISMFRFYYNFLREKESLRKFYVDNDIKNVR